MAEEKYFIYFEMFTSSELLDVGQKMNCKCYVGLLSICPVCVVDKVSWMALLRHRFVIHMSLDVTMLFLSLPLLTRVDDTPKPILSFLFDTATYQPILSIFTMQLEGTQLDSSSLREYL